MGTSTKTGTQIQKRSGMNMEARRAKIVMKTLSACTQMNMMQVLSPCLLYSFSIDSCSGPLSCRINVWTLLCLMDTAGVF